MQQRLTEKEAKLMKMALGSSFEQEAEAAWLLLLRSLRTRKAAVHDFELAHEQDGKEKEAGPEFGGVMMPFGKYKGLYFRDIPPDYLIWARNWINEYRGRATKFARLREAIELYLYKPS